MNKPFELYVHIPFCMHKCNYCDFLSAPADEHTQINYIEALLREIEYYGARCRDREVSTIYIGGGTPSMLQPVYMERILHKLNTSFEIQKDAEITIECNPGTITESKLKCYKDGGVNRLSIGLQSTMDDELQELGRIHTYEQFLRNYQLARNVGFHNINIDLMSALPKQSLEKFMLSLKRVAQLRPEHISAYSLIIEKGTPFYEKYKFDSVKREAGMQTEVLPSEETEYQIYSQTQDFLQQAGYHHYEISNYARNGQECRHNIGYWKRTEYLGLGLGASSLMNNVRYTNQSDLSIYIEESESIQPVDIEDDELGQAGFATNLHTESDVVTRSAQMEEFMFLGLRMTDGIARKEFFENFGVEIEAVYGEIIPQLAQEELISLKEGQIKLTRKGTDISNYVLAQFLLGD